MKIFTLLLFLISTNGHAQQSLDIRRYSNDLRIEEKRDFDFVTNTCNADTNSMAALLDSAKNDSMEDLEYFFTLGESSILQENIVTRKGIGKHVHRLLNSSGYYYGLVVCFPHSEAQRHQYTIKLLLLDAFGKFSTLSILTVTGASIYKLLSYLGKKIAVAPTVVIFKKLKASDEFVAKVPKYMGATGVVTFNVVTLGTLATQVYIMKKDREIMDEAFASPDKKEIEENLQKNMDIYNQLQELSLQAKTRDQKKLIENLIKEQQKTIAFYQKKLAAGFAEPDVQF